MKAHALHPQRERGAILVVSLLLLLVMTALALTASQTTRLQERMAGNARDLDLAFQGAEAGLREAERRVEDEAEDAGRRIIQACADPASCTILQRPATPPDYRHATLEWWNDNAVTYGAATQEFDELADDPMSRSEVWTTVSDTLTEGRSTTGTAFYLNTSRSVGGTETAEVIVQSVYATPYVE